MNTTELQKLPLFAGLSPEENGCLEEGEELHVPAGEIIIGSSEQFFVAGLYSYTGP